MWERAAPVVAEGLAATVVAEGLAATVVAEGLAAPVVACAGTSAAFRVFAPLGLAGSMPVVILT